MLCSESLWRIQIQGTENYWCNNLANVCIFKKVFSECLSFDVLLYDMILCCWQSSCSPSVRYIYMHIVNLCVFSSCICFFIVASSICGRTVQGAGASSGDIAFCSCHITGLCRDNKTKSSPVKFRQIICLVSKMMQSSAVPVAYLMPQCFLKNVTLEMF